MKTKTTDDYGEQADIGKRIAEEHPDIYTEGTLHGISDIIHNYTLWCIRHHAVSLSPGGPE